MAKTVLTPLGKEYYGRGLGPVIAIMLDTGVGVRLGDPEKLSVNVNEEEGEDIKSNEFSEIYVVDQEPGTKKVEIELILKQLSPTARAAAVMGEQGVLSQTAMPGRTYETTVEGIYHVETYDMTDLSVIKTADSTVAVEGVDFTVDRRMGLLEDKVGGLTWTWDQPAITGRFITGIASGSGIRCRLIFPGVNAKGKRSGAVIREVVLKPSAARDFVSSELMKISLKGLATPFSGPDVQPGTEIGYETDLPSVDEA